MWEVDAKEPLALGLRAASGGALAAEIWNRYSLEERRSPKGGRDEDRSGGGVAARYRAAGVGRARRGANTASSLHRGALEPHSGLVSLPAGSELVWSPYGSSISRVPCG